jgi:hypothetical protein
MPFGGATRMTPMSHLSTSLTPPPSWVSSGRRCWHCSQQPTSIKIPVCRRLLFGARWGCTDMDEDELKEIRRRAAAVHIRTDWWSVNAREDRRKLLAEVDRLRAELSRVKEPSS